MDADLQRIARRALEEAQVAGKDYLSQTEAAVRAVLVGRPEITAPEASVVTNLMRPS